jgi:hypothetical protein
LLVGLFLGPLEHKVVAVLYAVIAPEAVEARRECGGFEIDADVAVAGLLGLALPGRSDLKVARVDTEGRCVLIRAVNDSLEGDVRQIA